MTWLVGWEQIQHKNIFMLFFLLLRNWHWALCPWIHQPLSLDSEERYIPTTCSATKGLWWQWFWENSNVLLIWLPGHAKDRPGESYIYHTHTNFAKYHKCELKFNLSRLCFTKLCTDGEFSMICTVVLTFVDIVTVEVMSLSPGRKCSFIIHLIISSGVSFPLICFYAVLYGVLFKWRS